MRYRRSGLLFVGIIFSAFYTLASADEVKSIVPAQEKAIAEKLGVDGPSETTGITSMQALGAVDLEQDFAALAGHSMRIRKVVIAPNGTVGVHQHTARPGVLYMLDGELTEFRNDHEGGQIRKTGDVSFEKNGVIHWWRNDSGSAATALVIDIIADKDS
jgi:quercetin dioxygenase-like cupin family protein